MARFVWWRKPKKPALTILQTVEWPGPTEGYEVWQRRFAEIEELPYDFDRWYVSDVSRG